MTRPLPGVAETLLFLGLGVVAVQAALVPLGPGGTLVPPDLLYCLAVAWVIRRPKSAPLWAITGLGLFADVMLSRPIGLGALGLLLASEWFRLHARRFHGSPFPLEWLAAATGFAAVLGGMTLALALVLAPRPGLATLLPYLAATAIAYPLVVLGLTWCLRVRAPGAQRFGNPLGRLP